MNIQALARRAVLDAEYALALDERPDRRREAAHAAWKAAYRLPPGVALHYTAVVAHTHRPGRRFPKPWLPRSKRTPFSCWLTAPPTLCYASRRRLPLPALSMCTGGQRNRRRRAWLPPRRGSADDHRGAAALSLVPPCGEGCRNPLLPGCGMPEGGVPEVRRTLPGNAAAGLRAPRVARVWPSPALDTHRRWTAGRTRLCQRRWASLWERHHTPQQG